MNESIALQGSIIIENSEKVREAISKALRARPSQLFVDLSEVTYLDTSGLATLLEAERIARKQGTRMVVGGVHDQPRHLLEISHLDRLFEMVAEEGGA